MGNPKGVKRDAEQFAQLERRRIKAAKLFDQGLSQAEVARRVGVHRQSVIASCTGCPGLAGQAVMQDDDCAVWIASIYTSGSRSVHCLIRLDAHTKAEWDAMILPLKRPLKLLGADTACLSAVRLTRLPGCQRPNKSGFQKLLYFCPDPTDARLLDLPVIQSRADALARWRKLCPRWKINQKDSQ